MATAAAAAAAAAAAVADPVRGVVVEKWTWEQVAHAIDSKQYHLLGRSKEQLQSYCEHKEEVLERYASMSDFLLQEVFHYECVSTAMPAAQEAATDAAAVAGEASEAMQTRLKAKKPDGGNHDQVVWRANDYPYYLVDGIHMDVVWCEAGSITVDVLHALIADKLPNHQVQTFENPVHLRSVPELHHVHVISRKIEECE